MNDLRDAQARHAFVEDWFLNRKNCEIDINGETFWLPELADENAVGYLCGLLDAAIAAGVGAVPDGVVKVPLEPTNEMVDAAREWSRKKYGMPITYSDAVGCWAAMINALIAPAPTSPAAAEEG